MIACDYRGTLVNAKIKLGDLDGRMGGSQDSMTSSADRSSAGGSSRMTAGSSNAGSVGARHSGRLAQGSSGLSSRTMMKQLSKDNSDMDSKIRAMEERIKELEDENEQLRSAQGKGKGSPQSPDSASKEAPEPTAA